MREALFSSLEAALGTLRDAAFLDLYAGSGAVGLEAASRGATPVLLVERDPRALATIRANVAAVGLPGVDVRSEPVERLLAAAPPTAYDAVFLDPPYADPVEESLRLLAARDWVRPGGVVVVERAARDAAPAWPDGMEPDRSRRYGDTVLFYGLWYGRRP